MKLKLLLFFAVLFATTASAQTFSVGGVNYFVISTINNTVGVTSSASYVGDLIVPSTVSNAGVSYTVVSILDSAFENSTTLTSITIPDTVTEIRNNAFRYCTNLTSVDMGDSVTSIGQLSFNACFSLTSVVIPSSVTNIDINAFSFCNTLTSVTVEWATPLSINSNVFQNVNIGSATLYVPAGTVATYQTAPVWQNFGTILPPPPATHLNFDGSNDYIELANEANFDFTNQMTVELWVHSNVLPQQWDALVVKGDDSWRLHLNDSGTVNFTCSGVTPTQEINSTTNINDGNWHHIAATLGDNAIKIYIDGILETQATASGVINNNTQTVLIGNNPIYPGRFFTGNMDDIRIWSVAKTADQINAGKNCELQGNETGLVAYYNFNQGLDAADNTSETTLTDHTANANNGTLNNFTLTGSTSNWLAGSPVTTGSIIPSEATVTIPVTYTQNDTASPLTAATGSNGTGLMWYTTETGGTGTTTAPIPDTSTVGSTSYWVSSTNDNGCESERTEIVVNVYAPATHLNFGAPNDYVDCGNGPSLQITGNTITLEAYVNFNFFGATPAQGNIINKDNISDNGYMLRAGGNGVVNFVIGNSGWNELFTPENTISINQWYHIAGVYDGINLKIYVDGIEVASQPLSVNIGNVTSNVNLGKDPYFSDRYIDASLEDVRIWNIARTAEQINGSKNCELQGNETGLVAYYNFNQGIDAADNTSETSLLDATSNANNGTLTNFALTGTTSNWLAGSPVTTGSIIPSEATVTTPVTYNQGDTASPLTATTGSNGTGLMWYTTETAGTSTTTAPTPDTSTVGSTSYWVSSTNDSGCESERSEIVVNVEETLGVNDFNLLSNITVYPNPTNGVLQVSNRNGIVLQLSIYDINGRLLLNKTSNQEINTIDISTFSNGIYVLKMSTDFGEITKRVIKN